MNKMVWTCVGVALAGAVGALVRFGVMSEMNPLMGGKVPVGTLLINVVGAFLLGWVNARLGEGEMWRVILGAGFLGTVTTFSAMMFEGDKMMTEGAYVRMAAYLAGSVFLGMLAVRLGAVVGGVGN